MGGLAGHMSHLYDNPDLTLGEIEDIFIRASSGRLVGTEKTDGQNIFLSYSHNHYKPIINPLISFHFIHSKKSSITNASY